MPEVNGTAISPGARSGASTAPGRAGAALLLLALMGQLGGCDAIYDDTKGWANRLEASVLEAAHEQEKDPRAQAPTPRSTGSQAKPAMTPIPAAPPQGLASLQPPRAPVEGGADGTVAGAAETLLGAEPPAESAGKQPEETKAAKDKGEEKGQAAKKTTPPLPKRKPEPQMVAAAKGAAKEAEPESEAPSTPDPVAMVLHLSSLRSEEAAKREWRTLKRDFPGPLNGLEAEIRRTELGDKGTFYRVLAGPLPSRSEAQEACDAMKTRNVKQYCRVLPSLPDEKSSS